MPTITKKDLIDRVARQTGEQRTATKKIVQSVLDNIVNELRCGNRLEFRDFGVFEIKERAARIAQNPKTLERIAVPAQKTVKFKIGRLLKVALASAEGRHSWNSERRNAEGLPFFRGESDPGDR